MKALDIGALRKSYKAKTLDIKDVLAHPIDQFKVWFEEALAVEDREANGMTLSTVDKEGRPSSRIVLLKGITNQGFLFYTNYQSRKGQQLINNPVAAIVFWWPALERQVRIEGKVVKTSEETSNQYFQSRPKGSQMGAWSSPQSQVIKDRSILTEKMEELESLYQSKEKLPRPPHWGGFCLIPDYVEFWQGRPSRLHDRIRFIKNQQSWQIDRLAP